MRGSTCSLLLSFAVGIVVVSAAPVPVETQAASVKDGTASLACTFMKCPKDTPYCSNGMCVKKKEAEKKSGFNFSSYTKGSKQFTGSFTKPGNYIKGGPDGKDSSKDGSKGDSAGGKGGFDYSKYTKGGKGGSKGSKGGSFDYSKYTKGSDSSKDQHSDPAIIQAISKVALVSGVGSGGDKTTVYKVQGSECGQVDIPSQMVSKAAAFGVKAGTCASAGYTVADGEKSIKVPVLGTIKVEEFKKAAASQYFDFSKYTKGGGKSGSTGGKGGFDFSKYTKGGGKGGSKGGFDFSKYTKGGKGGSKGGSFDYQSFMGGGTDAKKDVADSKEDTTTAKKDSSPWASFVPAAYAK